MCWRLQPCVMEAATLGVGGCNSYVMEAATLSIQALGWWCSRSMSAALGACTAQLRHADQVATLHGWGGWMEGVGGWRGWVDGMR